MSYAIYVVSSYSRLELDNCFGQPYPISICTPHTPAAFHLNTYVIIIIIIIIIDFIMFSIIVNLRRV